MPLVNVTTARGHTAEREGVVLGAPREPIRRTVGAPRESIRVLISEVENPDDPAVTEALADGRVRLAVEHRRSEQR